jgi:hypothetical protein
MNRQALVCITSQTASITANGIPTYSSDDGPVTLPLLALRIGRVRGLVVEVASGILYRRNTLDAARTPPVVAFQPSTAVSTRGSVRYQGRMYGVVRNQMNEMAAAPIIIVR